MIYRSPNSNDIQNENITRYIRNLPENSIVVGDFNFPDIDWSTLSCTASSSRLFLDAVNDKFLTQLVDFPTNLTPQANGGITETCIDLVMTTNENMVASVTTCGQLAASKHTMIMVEIVVPSTTNETTELVPDYEKADFASIRKKLSEINWVEQLAKLDTEKSWLLFKETFNKTIDESIPKKKRRNNSKPLWMKRNVMRIIRKKKRLWTWYCSTKEYTKHIWRTREFKVR